MRAIIPVAGAGKRLRPFTYTQPKPLIPVAGKPILSYIVDELVGLGIEEFVFVIGYLGEKIRSYVNETYPALRAAFVEQTERRGSGHAIWLARDAMDGDDEAVVVFGDTIIEGRLADIVHCDRTCMAIKPVDDPRRFGVVETRPDGTIRLMVEKPRMPKSNLALVGFYKIADYPALHAILERLLGEATPRQETTLTDGLMAMLDEGAVMHAEQIDRWYDCGDAEVLLETNRVMLAKLSYADSMLPAYDRTIIVHPVTIGPGCIIQDAIIGPNVSIGAHTTVTGSIVRESIIGRYAQIRDLSLSHSIVGNDTALGGQPQSINIGDNTELSLR